MGPCPAIRASSRWPAIILAASRTERVSGRITLLIISIRTINGIRTGGVPSGTRCASMEAGDFSVPISMCPTHRGIAIPMVKIMWLEEVNTYGISPKALFSIIKINREIGIKINPGLEEGSIMALNSVYTLKVIFLKTNIDWLEAAQKIGGMASITAKEDSQFKGRENQEFGSKVEKRLFIEKSNFDFNNNKGHNEEHKKH